MTSKQRRGTAWKAFEGYDAGSYSVAGKTGTAQADGKNAVLERKKEDSAIFVAWAPQHDPRYAVAVVMEEAGYGILVEFVVAFSDGGVQSLAVIS